MNCPNCAAELKLEGEFYHSYIELDIDTADGGVVIIFTCFECGVDLGEYEFELDQDITDFSRQHEDDENNGIGSHELSVTLENESYSEHTDDNGVVYPGASATIKVRCSCGAEERYPWRDYGNITDIMKELS